MMKEWDKIRNDKLGLDPKILSVNYNKGEKPYWICNIHNESYRQFPKNKNLNYAGCPKCKLEKNMKNMNLGYLKRSGTLATKFPEIAEEFDLEANYPQTPNDFSPKSCKKVYWHYKNCGHKAFQVIANRTYGNKGCPYCSGRLPLKGFNDLITVNPALCEEWDYKNNNKIGIYPDKIMSKSSKKVWWICNKCQNNWKARIVERVNGKGCSKCAQAYQSSFHEQAIYYYAKKSFKRVYNSFELGKFKYDIFIEDINTLIEYDGFYWHKNKQNIDNQKNNIAKKNGYRLIRLRDEGLPKLNNYSQNIIVCNDNILDLENGLKKLFTYLNIKINIDLKKDYANIKDFIKNNEQQNSIYNKYPDIANEWHSTLNGNLSPKNFTKGSTFPAFWQCSKCGYGTNGEWQTEINNRCISGTGCPACANKVVYKGHNNFASQAPKYLLNEWNYEKNIKGPDEYVLKSSKSVYWKCLKCGYGIKNNWKATIYERVVNHTGCPVCKNRILVEGINDLKTKYPEIANEWHPTLNKICPNKIIYVSHKKFYWKCPKCGYGTNGEWYTSIYSRVKRKSGCGACKFLKLYPGFNDLKTRNPELAKIFSSKNREKPEEILYAGKTKYIWKCPKCNKEYLNSIYNFKKGINAHKCK